MCNGSFDVRSEKLMSELGSDYDRRMVNYVQPSSSMNAHHSFMSGTRDMLDE
jgi:hypothetical protein